MSNAPGSTFTKLLIALAVVFVFGSSRAAHAQFSPSGSSNGPVIGAGSSYQPGPVNRGPIERVVQGTILSKTEKPVNGAIVYLKDSKSLAVKTYITDSNGNFRFGQLSQNVDYEIWSELNGERSRVRRISSFDSRNSFTFLLKLDQTKSDANTDSKQ
jgi:hypothetical protein